MDPDVCLSLMRDTSLSPAHRLEAANELSAWVARGGFPPHGLTDADVWREVSTLRRDLSVAPQRTIT